MTGEDEVLACAFAMCSRQQAYVLGRDRGLGGPIAWAHNHWHLTEIVRSERSCTGMRPE